MSKKSRNTYAKPIPMNVMTVQLPFVDEYTGKLDDNGAYKTYQKKLVKSLTWKELLRAFPTRSAGSFGPVICACKLASVTVGPSVGGLIENRTLDSSDDAKFTEGNQYVRRPAKIVFGDGVQYEAASNKLLKARPSEKNVFNTGGWKNISFPTANGVSVYNGGITSYTNGGSTNSGGTLLDNDIAFTYEGELKAVTLSFRLVDRIEVAEVGGKDVAVY